MQPNHSALSANRTSEKRDAHTRRDPRQNSVFIEIDPCLTPVMKIEVMHIGMKVRHPQYGVGTVKSLSERTAEIRFEDTQRTIDPDLSGTSPAEPQAGVSGLEVPLKQFVETTVENTLDRLGFEKPDAVIEQLGARWHKGKLV